jgi:uncharacterized NAD-dependent epimerase/dehydratase family protein
VHVPFQEYIEGVNRPECKIPRVQDEIELVRMYGAKTMAVCLNGVGGSPQDLISYQKELQAELDVPVVRPWKRGLKACCPKPGPYWASQDAAGPARFRAG